jgi:ABC-type glycerol-3-phosphate transport system permease component
MATITLPEARKTTIPFYKTRSFGNSVKMVIVYILLIGLSLVFLFPFFWMLSSSLKTNDQIFLWPPQWFPDPIVWQNYADAFSNPYLPFLTFFQNTMIIEVGVMVGKLLSCVLVAYGFARLHAPGKNFVFGILLATFMLPGAVLMIPKYILFNYIGWINTFLPLIVPSWFGESYAIFLMRQFFMSIPIELEEAATMDGANTYRIIRNIIVPLSTPILAVIAVLTFKDEWNDFFGPLLYLNDSSHYTLSVGLAYFNGQYTVQMNLLMAASTVMMLPLVIVFFFGQKAFVEGISLTGIAGR